MAVNRREFVIGSTMALAGASAGGIRTAHASDETALYEAAKKEGAAVMYCSGPLDTHRKMLDAFEAKYPGIPVDLQRIVSTQQYQKFLSESSAGQNIVDVLQLSDKPSVEDLIGRGLIAEHEPPTGSSFSSAFRIPSRAYTLWSTDCAVMYNTGMISDADAELLKDWKGILDPRFKGRIAMRAKLDGIGYAPFLYWLDAAKDEYGEGFMEALAAQEPKLYADPVQAGHAVLIGEQAVWFTGWESLAVQYALQGGPVRWVFPNPCPAFGLAWTFVNANAPHPNAARLLMNWWASDDAASVIEKEYFARASKGGREDGRSVTKEAWYVPIGDRAWEPDYKRWAEARAGVNELWKKHFGKFGAV